MIIPLFEITLGMISSFAKKDAHPIITVQASEEYFIDFALRYIDRIRILDTDAGNKIKKQIAKKVNFL